MTGTGGGTYPGVLPTTPTICPLNVASVPPGATVVTEVRLRGISHTWVGDLQFVLTTPSGQTHNLLDRPPFSCDLGGDYTIVPIGQCALSYPAGCTGTAIFPVGAYEQNFGNWPSGTNGINNTPLETIPAATGSWTLTIYDWAGGDIGAITSWELCFGTPPSGASAPFVAPTPISPVGGALVTAPVTLTWSSLNCATSYDVDVDGVVTTGIASTSTSVNPTVGQHSWRVRAVNAGGAGPWSSPLAMFDIAPPPPPSTCVSGGLGGPIPTSGTGGGGTWPTILPPNEFTSTYNVAVPAGSTQLVKVELNGLSHTWVGDLQVVITDPTGGNHNVMYRPQSSTNSVGLNCDLDGSNYHFYQAGVLDLPTTCPGTSFPGGQYNQYFGDWTSGDAGIFNTPLGQIPVSSGNWTLKIYDWAGGDIGDLVSWQLCFAAPAGPTTFCTPTGSGTSSGCIPTIAATGSPNVSHTAPCVVTVSNVEGQKSGLLFYGINGQINFPWCAAGGNSFLCVKAPTQRLFPQSTGGTAGQCNGQLTNNWNLFQTSFPGSLGQPFSAGDTVDMQGWFRDPPSCKTTFLSEGLRLVYQP